jgi:hypothetical protein
MKGHIKFDPATDIITTATGVCNECAVKDKKEGCICKDIINFDCYVCPLDILMERLGLLDRFYVARGLNINYGPGSSELVRHPDLTSLDDTKRDAASKAQTKQEQGKFSNPESLRIAISLGFGDAKGTLEDTLGEWAQKMIQPGMTNNDIDKLILSNWDHNVVTAKAEYVKMSDPNVRDYLVSVRDAKEVS